MNGFLFHPEAELDLDEIWDFVAEYSYDVADRIVSEIIDAIALAASMPHTGHRRTDLTSRSLRFLHVRDYIVAYAPEEPLCVVAVVHGRRNPRVLAAILRNREA